MVIIDIIPIAVLVTVDTTEVGVVRLVHMTVGAIVPRLAVLSGIDREVCAVMIEGGIVPVTSIVTVDAVRTETGLTVIGGVGAVVIVEMTRHAPGRCTLIITVDVALCAIETAMALVEREETMVETAVTPGTGIVTFCAVCREAGVYMVRCVGCLVVIEMTGVARVACTLEDAAHVALAAIDQTVALGEGVEPVIETSVAPCAEIVALGAICGEAGR